MPQPNLGYGNTAEVDLDKVNQWMRTQPWYQELLASFGQSPDNVHLNDDQKQQVIRAAQGHGVVVDEGHNGQEVDDSGNFRGKGHKLRNTLIVAGVAAAALATMGAAGVFSGAAGAAEGAGAGLGGVEAGAAAGLDASVASGALASGAGAGLGVGADIAGAGAFDAAGNFVGDSTISSIGAAGGGSSTAARIAAILGAGGKGIGAATTAAGQNRQTQESEGLIANAQNITGQSAFEAELMNRAKEEATQRTGANKDVYRQSVIENPRVSPFDPVGAPKYSDQYKATEKGLADQGATTLAKPATFSTAGMPSLKPYTPIDPKNVQAGTGTTPSTLENIGKWLGPGMTIADLIAQMAR